MLQETRGSATFGHHRSIHPLSSPVEPSPLSTRPLLAVKAPQVSPPLTTPTLRSIVSKVRLKSRATRPPSAPPSILSLLASPRLLPTLLRATRTPTLLTASLDPNLESSQTKVNSSSSSSPSPPPTSSTSLPVFARMNPLLPSTRPSAMRTSGPTHPCPSPLRSRYSLDLSSKSSSPLLERRWISSDLRLSRTVVRFRPRSLTTILRPVRGPSRIDPMR
jgi:hypothetical protein